MGARATRPDLLRWTVRRQNTLPPRDRRLGRHGRLVHRRRARRRSSAAACLDQRHGAGRQCRQSCLVAEPVHCCLDVPHLPLGDSTADWRSATLVGETPASTTCFTDVTVAPKTQLHYMVMALTSEGLHAMSDEKSVLLPPGMDYPFIDTVETDGAYWVGDGGWARSDERACSGTRAWSDSPGALYPNPVTPALVLPRRSISPLRRPRALVPAAVRHPLRRLRRGRGLHQQWCRLDGAQDLYRPHRHQRLEP